MEFQLLYTVPEGCITSQMTESYGHLLISGCKSSSVKFPKGHPGICVETVRKTAATAMPEISVVPIRPIETFMHMQHLEQFGAFFVQQTPSSPNMEVIIANKASKTTPANKTGESFGRISKSLCS